MTPAFDQDSQALQGAIVPTFLKLPEALTRQGGARLTLGRPFGDAAQWRIMAP